MNNAGQRSRRNCYFNRGLADVFTVGVYIQRALGFDAEAFGLEVFDFRNA